MAEDRDYTVLIFVEAETPQLAREAAVGELMAKTVADRLSLRGFSLSYVEPVRANSDEGREVAHNMWIDYLQQNVQDLMVLCKTLVPHLDSEEPPIEILDDWGFRSACLRLGTIESWPIRIYAQGLGVNNSSILHDLLEDDSLWVVTAQIK